MSTTFKYSVRDTGGKLVTGALEADNEAAVARKLLQMGYAPVSITSDSKTGLQKDISIPGFKARVKLKDLAIFARQFSTMVNSGLSLLRALAILCDQTDNKELARVLTEVRNDVETGSALSVSMGKHPDAFPPLMINMIKAGEVGGFLDSVMLQIAENFESEVKLRGKVKSAMTYPVVVFIMAMIMCVIMLIFIVPVFAGMFDSLGGQLPFPTQMLVYASDILRWTAPFLVVGLIAGVIVWRRVKDREGVRNVVDPIKLRTPVFGSLFQKIALSRFSRNLGTMMRSGVPILQSLDIVADTTGSVVVAHAVRDVQQSVRGGESLAAPLTEHKVFPAMVVQMMAVGEETGALDTMLLKISDFYDQEVEATTEQLTALIEPLMIAFLGVVVGGMIVALYMPIFKIFDLIGG
jgi:type IV pilus assembly protein PilC